jgi:hypothetical protein
MVDRRETNEAEVRGAPADRKVWITPRLETADLSENTDALGNNPPPEGGLSTS